MLRFLPEPFHPYIHANTLNSEYPLTFTGVKECSIPDHFEGAWWLYNEIYCTDTGFELHVLFDCPLIETAIIAENVTVEELD